ncbi:predicted protein [Chaetoceros tenuissimus]|uniref:Uncharacterized protein n=1 Tax=Chaetoceros tenuissimus TaxID=426638 RepID=A0AAD3D2Z3_9STRA|nr:predicted protein [Chaetoceros tenuissimus]
MDSLQNLTTWNIIGDDHTDHDDFYDDCSYEYVLSEGPPEITDSCLTYVYNIVAANPNLFLVRYLYGFFTEFDNLEYYFDLFGFGFGGDVDKILANFTDTCEDSDASVYFTKGETNGKCFSEDYYGNQTEAEGWDVLPECIPNKCTQEEALEAYQTLYSMEFESQPECVFELEYTFPPDDETPEESPPSPPSPDGPSKAPKSMKSAKSTKNSKAPKMVKMPKMPKTVKMPKMVKMAKAAKDEYKGLRSSFLH